MSINTNDATTTDNIKKTKWRNSKQDTKNNECTGHMDNIRGVNNINIVLYKEGCVACIHSCYSIDHQI